MLETSPSCRRRGDYEVVGVVGGPSGVAAKRRGWWSVLTGSETLPDQFQHLLQILEHMTILQPQHGQARGTEKSLASLVPDSRALAVVRRSFQLDDKSLVWAIEVNDVGPDTVLSPEFSTLQLRALEYTPKCCFGRRQASAQRPASFAKRRMVVKSSVPHSSYNAEIPQALTGR